jgi:predicted AAA+ superfamily ATPase
MFLRKQILEGSGNESLFLWGTRQTGKSTLLKMLFPEAVYFDLLQSDVGFQLSVTPNPLKGNRKFKGWLIVMVFGLSFLC